MNERTTNLRIRLLRRFYKSAVLGWARPRTMHWGKIVNSQNRWRWTRADMGIQGRFVRDPPVHVYQTLLRYKTESYPKGYATEGYLLGGPYLFDMDMIDNNCPFSLWRMVDCAEEIQELIESVTDRFDCKVMRVIFSGFRGVHVVIELRENEWEPIRICSGMNRELRAFQHERMQTARSIGHWCQGWDWTVSADIWRVARVPWSIHGRSALRAIALEPPYTPNRFKEQLAHASPFSLDRQLRVRITRPVQLFTFIDEESYGPYRKDWVTRLPIAVALHLIWQGYAKPREDGPWSTGSWFDRGWQILFRDSTTRKNMVISPVGGDGG